MGSYLLRQTWVPKEKNGSVNANLRMFFMAAAPVSSLAQGWLIDRFGIGISIGLGVASLWGCWWFSRELADAYERAVFSHTPESEERKLSA
jgi:hypothetical protein